MIPYEYTPAQIMLERSGRTDSNVSGINQTISLFIRCQKDESNITFEQLQEIIQTKSFDKIEIQKQCKYNYSVIINKYLPDNIHILSYNSNIKPDFSARYDTITRSYVYFYPKNNFYKKEDLQNILNIYKGTHDFRNFCYKKPEDREENYTKTILKFNVEDFNENLYQIQIQGSGFLYHQIRYMIGAASQVLYGRFQLKDIQLMLDDIHFKKEYIMAPAEFLSFSGCEYQKQVYNKEQNQKTDSKVRQNRNCIEYATQITRNYLMQNEAFVEFKSVINWFEQSMGLKRK